MSWLSGARCLSAIWKHSGDKDIQRWFPRTFLFRFNLAGAKYQLFWETHVGKVHVVKLAGWESFHFRHFPSDFRVGLAGSFSPLLWCFWCLPPHRGCGCFLQLSFLGRFLHLKQKKKKKKWVKHHISQFWERVRNITDLQFRVLTGCCYGNQLWNFFILILRLLFLLYICRFLLDFLFGLSCLKTQLLSDILLSYLKMQISTLRKEHRHPGFVSSQMCFSHLSALEKLSLIKASVALLITF